MENIYEVCWVGPYLKDNLNSVTEEQNKKFILYKIYGAHPIYGDNILLYIGMTEQNVIDRLAKHDYWMDWAARFKPCRIYFASIGKFESWDQAREVEIYDPPERAIIENVESLLIYAHQPAYNKNAKDSADSARNTRLFNTGNYGALMPEVSALGHEC